MIYDKVDILKRVALLRKRAAERNHCDEDDCHLGHLSLQAMLDEPGQIHQIDAATGSSETNKSVARRTCRLASAMWNYGLRPGDTVVIMGPNHLDLTIPFYACHLSGFSACVVDPVEPPEELNQIISNVLPRMVFCHKSCEVKVRQAIKLTKQKCEVILFDDNTADIEAFVRYCNGTQVNFRPPIIDQSNTIAWLIMTSGTTGAPKVAMVSFKNVLNGVISWWAPYPGKVEKSMAMAPLQWLSSYIYFMSTPLKGFTRVQSSESLIPQRAIALINTYRPNTTAWTPFLLGHFLEAAEDNCDLSCFTGITIGGGGIEKPVLDAFRKKCSAQLCVVYGMTELVVPVFSYTDETPYGSSGKPLANYEYKLIDDDNQPLMKPFKTGELWIKGNDFFKGYLNSPEETALILTDDGWFKTGDMFYRDDQEYYFFVERKRLIIRHYGFKISPLQLEKIIKCHPSVAEVCVVGLPDPNCLEIPIAAIKRKNGNRIEPQEIFDLLTANLPNKKLAGGLFFVDSFPITPSGKLHRSKVKQLAATAQIILPKPTK